MKQKRTKRYGGFLVGDRVRVKTHPVLGVGTVVGFNNGYIEIYFTDYDSHWQCDDKEFAFMPNQLVNLTRQEEEMKVKRIDWEIEEAFKKIFGKSSTEAIRDSFDLQAKYLCQNFTMPTIDWNSVNIDIFHQDRTIRFSPSDLPDTPLNML